VNDVEPCLPAGASGLVAARDGDYGAFRWYPDEPALDRWLALYRKNTRRNAGGPDAGRFLLAWAHAAGFDDVAPGASVWCFATPDDRAWWGGLWADRMTDSAIARQAVEGRCRRSHCFNNAGQLSTTLIDVRAGR
jgi:hypothetical protein